MLALVEGAGAGAGAGAGVRVCGCGCADVRVRVRVRAGLDLLRPGPVSPATQPISVARLAMTRVSGATPAPTATARSSATSAGKAAVFVA